MGTENALLDESFSETAESARTAHVRELLRLLVKAQKAQRLYEGKNAVSQRLEQDFYDRLSAFLETDGEIQLAVHEFDLECEHEIVYESDDRKDSLAFLLYRDGVLCQNSADSGSRVSVGLCGRGNASTESG